MLISAKNLSSLSHHFTAPSSDFRALLYAFYVRRTDDQNVRQRAYNNRFIRSPQVLGNKIRNNRDHRSVSHWTPSDFVKDCLFWHNFYRRFHRSSELVLSPHVSWSIRRNALSRLHLSDEHNVSRFFVYQNIPILCRTYHNDNRFELSIKFS